MLLPFCQEVVLHVLHLMLQAGQLLPQLLILAFRCRYLLTVFLLQSLLPIVLQSSLLKFARTAHFLTFARTESLRLQLSLMMTEK